MNLNDTRISTRLAFGFGAMVLLIVLMGGASLLKMNAVERDFAEVVDDRYPKIAKLNDAKSDVNQIARSMRNVVLMSKPDDVRKELDTIEQSKRDIDATLKELDAQIRNPKGREALAAVGAARAPYSAAQTRFLELVKAGQPDEAKALLFGEVRPLQLDYFARLDALIKFQSDLMSQSSAEAARTIAQVRAITWSSLIGAVLFGIALAVWIVRSITRPLNQALEVSRAVAGGDLTVAIHAEGRNEMALLLAALKNMQDSLSNVVHGVRQNADAVATASGQISQGNNDLSSRTEEQASALEQTSAAMRELASTVQQNAQNAQAGNALAADASSVAERGGSVVGQVVETMKGINDSSRRIADIIGTIDGIAFQTNILALNAAVEAARAGEQGRGFAVVAGEVRTLAQRSAEAAKQIKDLIGTSVERVEQGSALVDQAGATMQEVVQAIQRVSTLMGEISMASTSQSASVAQVGEAVNQMDQTTQQNAALVEQSAAAAESLKSQADSLVRQVAVFKLSGTPALAV